MNMQPTPLIPYSSIYIDIKKRDLVQMAKPALMNYKTEDLNKRIREVFLKDMVREQCMTTLCVRASLDLIFQSYDYEVGSEVMMTCINIPSMAQIVRYHSLVPIPVNVDFENLMPSIQELEEKRTDKTKMLIISYVYGATFDSQSIIDWAHSHNIVVIEDMAESFKGNKFTGNLDADFSLFSFGTIKTCTAFGGSIMVVRDNKTKFQQLQQIYNKYPKLANSFFMKRCLKNSIGMLALNNTKVNSILRIISRQLQFDYKEKMVGLVRGFPGSNDFLQQFRQQMPTSMLYLLNHRLQTYKNEEQTLMDIKQHNAQDYLIKNGVQVPGYKVKQRTFWLFPILAPQNTKEFVNEVLNKTGVDVYKGATQLQVISPPTGYQKQGIQKTKTYFDNFLYIPINKGVPEDQIKIICDKVIKVISVANKISKQNNKSIKSNKNKELQFRAKL